MKAIAAILGGALLLSACAQPEPICDREAQAWDKFGTQEDVCMVTPVTIVGLPDGDDPHDPVPPVFPPSEPPSEPPVEPAAPGNPGNDKPVGKSGEKPEKGMDENSPEGNRGRSN